MNYVLNRGEWCCSTLFHLKISFDLVSIGRYIYFIAIELKLANKYVFTSPSITGIRSPTMPCIPYKINFRIIIAVFYRLCIFFFASRLALTLHIISREHSHWFWEEARDRQLKCAEYTFTHFAHWFVWTKWKVGKTHNRTTSQMIPFQFPFFSLLFFLFIVCFIGFLITFDTNRGEIGFCCLRIGQMICYNGLARRIGKCKKVEIHHIPASTNLVTDFEIQIIIGFFDLQLAPYRLRINTKFGGGCADLIRCFSWRHFVWHNQFF